MKLLNSKKEFEVSALPHIDDLFRFALRVTRNRTEAEDMVQEAYFQAWKSFHRFQPGTNCRAWMFKILVHMIQRNRRRWVRFDSKLIDLGEDSIEETVVYEPPVAEDLSDEDVIASLDRIPQPYREVILLADVQEFAYKEIADLLSIPIGTVMSRLNRGRKLLRRELADYARTCGIKVDMVQAARA